MSLLEQQLKELQSKKSKVEYFKHLLSTLVLSKEIQDHAKDAVAEVSLELEAFINKRIATIEEGGADELYDSSPNKTSDFNQDEIDVLRQIAIRALQRSVELDPTPIPVPQKRTAPVNRGAFDDETEELPPRRQNNPPPASPRAKKVANQDKVSFAMSHRHLAEKRCSVTSSNGNKALGKIVGTDAPFLVVQLDTGHTINVPPEEVTVG